MSGVVPGVIHHLIEEDDAEIKWRHHPIAIVTGVIAARSLNRSTLGDRPGV